MFMAWIRDTVHVPHIYIIYIYIGHKLDKIGCVIFDLQNCEPRSMEVSIPFPPLNKK